MSRAKRLGRLEQVAAEKVRAGDLPISIQWVTPDGVAESPQSSDRPAAVTIWLTLRGDDPAPAPNQADDIVVDAAVAASDQPTSRGQRLRPPTREEQEAARAVLRDRARRGLYLGYVPPSEAQLAAESARRQAEQQDAVLMRATARPAPERPEAVNRLSQWVWRGR